MHDFYPLVTIRDPAAVWAENPSLLLTEVVFFVMVAIALIQMYLAKDPAYRVLALASFFGGACIELFTIMEPQIGNFYHSQATIMLFGRREPAWMLCYYIFFQYLAVAICWRLRAGIWVETCFAGLFSSLSHALLDQVGFGYLWWTWHNAEPMYDDRRMGVPIASTFWVMCNVAGLAFLMHFVRKKSSEGLSFVSQVFLGLLIGPLAALVLMHVPFMTLFHPMVTWQGYHAWTALTSFRAISALVVLAGFFSNIGNLRFSFNGENIILVILMGFAFIPFHAGVPQYLDPKAIVRTSFGQPFGECGVTEESFWGAFVRGKFVCPTNTHMQRDQYDFHCVNEPGEALLPSDLSGVLPHHNNNAWYTVCGVDKPQNWHDDVLYHSIGLVILLLLTMFSFGSASSKKLKPQ